MRTTCRCPESMVPLTISLSSSCMSMCSHADRMRHVMVREIADCLLGISTSITALIRLHEGVTRYGVKEVMSTASVSDMAGKCASGGRGWSVVQVPLADLNGQQRRLATSRWPRRSPSEAHLALGAIHQVKIATTSLRWLGSWVVRRVAAPSLRTRSSRRGRASKMPSSLSLSVSTAPRRPPWASATKRST